MKDVDCELGSVIECSDPAVRSFPCFSSSSSFSVDKPATAADRLLPALPWVVVEAGCGVDEGTERDTLATSLSACWLRS